MEAHIINKEENNLELTTEVYYYMILPRQIKGSVCDLEPGNHNKKLTGKSTDSEITEIAHVVNRVVTVVSGKLNIPTFSSSCP